MKGPLSYAGGKNRIANSIIAKFPKHTTYVEAFAGGAQVLFHKEPSKVEIINDIDGELVNFYRVCQSHYEELIRYTRFMHLSRELFSRLHETSPQSLTDIQRAARYFYLQKSAYGGRITRQAYAIHVVQPPNFTPERAKELIERTHLRLDRVQIEQLPYDEVVRRYDRATTFFYLDPPYYGIRLYRHNMKHGDFEKMADVLRVVKGKFILSINDHPEIRRLFQDFTIETVPITYSMHSAAGKRYQELLIRNY